MTEMTWMVLSGLALLGMSWHSDAQSRTKLPYPRILTLSEEFDDMTIDEDIQRDLGTTSSQANRILPLSVDVSKRDTRDFSGHEDSPTALRAYTTLDTSS